MIKAIKEIKDEENLLFMIQQTNVIKYNMQVDKINNEQQKISHNSKTSKKSRVQHGSGIEIIPGEENKNFIIQMGVARKFFSRPDFRSMVMIAQNPDSIKLVSTRLYNWLNKERRDVLIDCNIRSSSNPLLVELIKLIKKKYKVKK